MASRSSLFGRSLAATALTKTPPFHNVGVQRSTPHFTDRYPYVRYSYGNTDTALGLATQTESVYARSPAIRDIGTKRWLEGKLTSYNPSLFSRPDYKTHTDRLLPQRSYIRYMPVDDAVDMYKKRCMTVGTLSKYWLSPATWASRREKDLNLSSSLNRGVYTYSNRVNRFTNRLY
ncbi:hypothetical protein DICVIV_03463 [Dictyocaulus viviparus]|uniref:Uncharacterized protein n=1 Tax=Dictyocaulus viviparus TaxID=29172 RepID=A0A0D8Y0J6_DICVI|nr:hypothetical protein DICVIV_03463 [Dictyocaulus viviparus]